MLLPERQPRQDISVLVNQWRDIYYLMLGSAFKAGLGSLLQKDTRAQPSTCEEHFEFHCNTRDVGLIFTAT